MNGDPGSAPAGWYGDPFDHAERRYWDGGRWTEKVRRAGIDSTDVIERPTVSTAFTRRRIIIIRFGLLNLAAYLAVVASLDATGAWAPSWNLVLGGAVATVWSLGQELDSRRRWRQILGSMKPDPDPVPHPPAVPAGPPRGSTPQRRESAFGDVLVYLGLRERPRSRALGPGPRPYFAAILLLVGVALIVAGFEGLGVFLTTTGGVATLTGSWRRHLLTAATSSHPNTG